MRIRFWVLAAVTLALGSCSVATTPASPRVAPELRSGGGADWTSVPQYGGELA